ncbi:AvrD family protein [Actinomadura roseirufa]|uniref:AvrD family protein n=1 Tax=Actinomadura roseirufa TaxID=2094049 RepID=UPI001A9552CC|nr:AvrD family protein [Actinomadura roseirufa]
MTLASVDDYLGPGETRFFSHGYRRVRYDVRDLAVSPGGVTGTASLAYPGDWSKKGSGDLRPHLSTVDSLVLAVQLAEAHLAHAGGLDAGARRAARLRRVALRAGTSPQEDLDAVPLKAAYCGSAGGVSVFECSSGVMRARCEIEHHAGGGAAGAAPNGAGHPAAGRRSFDDLLGPGIRRFYGEGFKDRGHRIEDVRVDMGGPRADGTVVVERSKAPEEGIDGAYQPSFSLIDAFVVNLQLAQILMYEMDGVSRADSNTLWMLRAVLDAGPARRPFDGPLAARTEITGRHLLPLRGATWRNADIAGTCGGVSLRCSFAHELPAGAARAARRQEGRR